jgi:anaerobic selenocysteine-containing dehydrogenase
MATEFKRSVCPYDCPDTCGLIVSVENGRAVSVAGDPEHPFTRGTLCPKMNHYERTVNAPERLTTPLIRTGAKGEGAFRPLPWPEAIGNIADHWRKIIARYGAEAILPYSYAGTMGLVQRNCGHPFFYRLGASRLERTICSSSKDAGWKAVMGNTLVMHPDEVAASDLVIIWSMNAVATNIHFLHGLREAKKRGAAVWLIDTYATPTAKLADRVFLTRPGSDSALALGMMHVMAREGLVDREFIDRFVQGYDDFAASVLPDYTPDKASAITGLPAATIEEMARLYAAAQAPFIRLGSGLCRYGNGAMSVRTVACLPALTGAWAREGGGVSVGVSSGAALDSSVVTREDFLPAPTRVVNMNKLGQALTELTGPPVMSLYVYHSNPAAIAPDQNKVLSGLAREDLFTIVHERFMTDTARYADIILPATTSLEHTDIYRAYGHYCVQLARPVTEPPGEAKANWEVFSLLAEAMGFEEPFFRQSADDIVEAILSKPTPWLAKTDLDKLRAGKAVELPLPVGHKLAFKTPSGKIELLSSTDPEPLPRYQPPHGDDAPFWLMTAPTPIMLNSSFCERTDLLAGQAMTLQMNPADAAAKKLADGQRVVAFNERGEVTFILRATDNVPAGVVVAEGVWWLKDAPGDRGVNALTSQRLTDRAAGSTFYDTKVDVRAE